MSRFLITPKQQIFLNSRQPLIIFRAGIRSGKSYIACVKAVMNALKGRRQLVVSNDNPQCRDVIAPTMYKVLDKLGLVEGRDFTYHKTFQDFLIRGTYVHLRSAERGDKIRGISCADGYIDEGRNIKTRDLYDIVIGRLSDCPDGQIHLTSSPKGKDWMYHLSQEEQCELIIQRTVDNVFLPRSYIERLKRSYTSKFGRQELDASIEEFSGGILDPDWFLAIEPEKPVRALRYWDTATTTKKQSDCSAGALCSFDKDYFKIHDMVKGKWLWPDLKKRIIEQAQIDGKQVTIALEKVGQSGAFADDLKRTPELRGYRIVAHTPRGSKVDRAQVWGARAESGLVKVCKASWNADFFEEVRSFSADDSHEHDDMVDAVSGAWELLSKPTGRAALINI